MYLTYRDMIDHLIDFQNLDGKDVQDVKRKIRRAVKEACQKFTSWHDWESFRMTGMVSTAAPYETGTVSYDLSTNRVTLSGGTWPADAATGDLIIDRSRYLVARRISDTVLELDPYQHPPANVSSGTTYRWVKPRYLLPAFVDDIREVTDIQLLSLIRRIAPDDQFWYSEAWNITGAPSAWTLVQSRQRPGQWEIWFSSVPHDIRSFRYLYQVRWYGTEVEELSAGTVSISSDVATFSNAILNDNCVGAVLRVSSSSTIPTSDVGRYDPATKNVILNPPDSEYIITAVTNNTTAVLNKPAASTITTKGFTISSHLNLNVQIMREAFSRMCEYQYHIISRADTKIIAFTRQIMDDSLRSAMIADGRNMDSQRAKIVDPRPIIRET